MWLVSGSHQNSAATDSLFLRSSVLGHYFVRHTRPIRGKLTWLLSLKTSWFFRTPCHEWCRIPSPCQTMQVFGTVYGSNITWSVLSSPDEVSFTQTKKELIENDFTLLLVESESHLSQCLVRSIVSSSGLGSCPRKGHHAHSWRLTVYTVDFNSLRMSVAWAYQRAYVCTSTGVYLY